ncbi:MAG TPA: GNAT family N-acetyltransferase [Anaerolineaceae bacterium]|nr:GNAT family N-acetyltransferase [Anaerolineaceae bacterium]
MDQFVIRPSLPSDRLWINSLMRESFGDERVVAHGAIYTPADLPGFIAEQGRERVGLITYNIDIESCEIVSLNSLVEDRGIGSALIAAVRQKAAQAACQRLWLVTTNDNLRAIGFYQKRGFRLADLRPGAVDEARKIKPAIPLIGSNGIPIHDEIELEIHL